jgi:YgiT-type zinc finger domain-containing protein
MSSTRPDRISCGVCGGAALLTREVRPAGWKRRYAEVEDEFYRCTACGEELYLPGMMNAVIERVRTRLAQQDDPDAVR